MWIELALAGTLAASPGSPADDAQLYTTPYFQTLGVAAGMPSSRIYKTVQDRDGYLWFGTQDGLARYDGVGFRVYRHDPKDPDSLGGNAVTALFVDRDNRIWCGGEESGLNLLDAGRNRFTHYRHDANEPSSLGADDVWTITQDETGAIWTGSYAGGLDQLKPGATGFVHFRHDSTNPQSISSDNVLGLLPQPGAGLWVGSDVGVDLIETGGKIRHVDFTVLAGNGRINAITLLDAGDGGVLAGTRRGLLRIDPAMTVSVVAADGLTDKLVYGVTTGASGELWVATRHGLNRLAPRGDIARYVENPAVPGAFPGDTVFDAMRDREGNLWATDVGAHTVMKINPAGEVLLTIGTKGQGGAWNEAAGTRLLNQPNDVAIAANGDIFVAQGHTPGENGDARVLKFDKTGKFITQWGGHGKEPGKFEVAHSIAFDSEGQLWVADRENQRIQIFDQDGKFIREIKYAGLPSSISIGKRYIYMVNGFAGQLLRMDLNGKVLAVVGKPGKGPGEFGEAHEVTERSNGEVWVADTVNSTVQKFAKK